MRIVLIAVVILVALVAGGFAVALSMGPKTPTPMGSVENAFAGVDFSDLPKVSHFTARDGTALSYRAYPGDAKKIAVLVHGSSGTSLSMHAVARAIHARGWTVYALSMRGHDGNGRRGDVDYVGQLDDDIADFAKTLPSDSERVLLGFSSGGGFVLRFAGGPSAKTFQRFVLISPQLPQGSPTMRPNAGGWVSVALPRIIAISILNGFGIHAFDGLTALAFAVPPDQAMGRTPSYSFRMMRNFGPSDDYRGDIKRAPGPVTLLAGTSDEMFDTAKFESTLKPSRPDMQIELLPGLGHMAMTVDPKALNAIADAVTR
jgi:alpha-beta hydrolase superfamily lysophospholipase